MRTISRVYGYFDPLHSFDPHVIVEHSILQCWPGGVESGLLDRTHLEDPTNMLVPSESAKTHDKESSHPLAFGVH